MSQDIGATSSYREPSSLVIFISSGLTAANADRRRAVRNSWMRYRSAPDSPLDEASQASLTINFVVSRGSFELQQEADEFGDMVVVDAPEGYEHLWRKALVYLALLESESRHYDYAMHADDDSFVRLDLLVPLLAACPRRRFYWGYIWDGTGARVTAPIRNRANKSFMPEEQYAPDVYPPFASGCGFVLSRDLVQALVRAAPLPDYRLLDPPFGIHLCSNGPACVLPEPVVPMHDERVCPYRPIPMFRPDTIVQHYLRPEEMRPYYLQALVSARAEPVQEGETSGGSRRANVRPDGTGNTPEELYNTLVAMGLLRR